MPRGILTPIDYRTGNIQIKRSVPDPERVRKCYDTVRQSPEQAGLTNWSFAKEIVMLDSMIKKEPVVSVEIKAIQMGPVVFITNPAELFCQLGLEIRARSPFECTFPVELANRCVCYTPTKESFGPHGGGYETRLTSFSNLEPSVGPKMADMGIDLAWQLTPGKKSEFTKAAPFSGKPWEYGSVKPELM
jgi:hypothetical protein